MIIRYIFFMLFCFSICAQTKTLLGDKDDAIRIGEAFLESIYGPEVLKQRPFKVSSTKNTWILDGTFHCPKGTVCVGGTAHIEFNKSDGAIVKVNHTK